MSNTRAISLWLISVVICILAVLVTVSAYAQDKAPEKAAATAPADAKAAPADAKAAPADAKAADAKPAEAAAAPAPAPNKGDTAWMIVATWVSWKRPKTCSQEQVLQRPSEWITGWTAPSP